MKSFENWGFDDDFNSNSVEEWLELNDFYLDNNGKYSTDSSFSVSIPHYLIDENGVLKVEFGKVNANFEIDCSSIYTKTKLKSLKNIPEIINGSLDILNCDITELNYMPLQINGNLVINRTNLENLHNLENCKIEYGVNVSYNKLTSLEGMPKELNGSFNCSNNKLTSLEGSPKKVSNVFNCSNNPITSFFGGPDYKKELIAKNVENISKYEYDFYSTYNGFSYLEDLVSYLVENGLLDKAVDHIDWPLDFMSNELKNIVKTAGNMNNYGLNFKN